MRHDLVTGTEGWNVWTHFIDHATKLMAHHKWRDATWAAALEGFKLAATDATRRNAQPDFA